MEICETQKLLRQRHICLELKHRDIGTEHVQLGKGFWKKLIKEENVTICEWNIKLQDCIFMFPFFGWKCYKDKCFLKGKE